MIYSYREVKMPKQSTSSTTHTKLRYYFMEKYLMVSKRGTNDFITCSNILNSPPIHNKS